MGYLDNEYYEDFPEEEEVPEEDTEEEDEDTIRELEVNERGVPMNGDFGDSEED